MYIYLSNVKHLVPMRKLVLLKGRIAHAHLIVVPGDLAAASGVLIGCDCHRSCVVLPGLRPVFFRLHPQGITLL